MTVKRTMYQRKVEVDMLNAVKSVLVDVSSVSLHTLHGVHRIHLNLDTLYELMIDVFASSVFAVVCLFVCLFVCF